MPSKKKRKKYESMKISDFISKKKLAKINEIADKPTNDLERSMDKIEDIMNDAGYKTMSTGTNRMVFTHPDYKDVIFKVAFDWHGKEANQREYLDRDISDSLVYTYLISEDYTFIVQEKVTVFTKDTVKGREDDIRKMLKPLEKKLLLCDCKIANYKNFGYRKDGSVCLLDHGDTIPLPKYQSDIVNVQEDFNTELVCKKVIDDTNPNKMKMCGGKLKYDRETYNHLVCKKCGQISTFAEASREFYGDARNRKIKKGHVAITPDIREWIEKVQSNADGNTQITNETDEKSEYKELRKESTAMSKNTMKVINGEECFELMGCWIPIKFRDDPNTSFEVIDIRHRKLKPLDFLKKHVENPNDYKVLGSDHAKPVNEDTEKQATDDNSNHTEHNSPGRIELDKNTPKAIITAKMLDKCIAIMHKNKEEGNALYRIYYKDILVDGSYNIVADRMVQSEFFKVLVKIPGIGFVTRSSEYYEIDFRRKIARDNARQANSENTVPVEEAAPTKEESLPSFAGVKVGDILVPQSVIDRCIAEGIEWEDEDKIVDILKACDEPVIRVVPSNSQNSETMPNLDMSDKLKEAIDDIDDDDNPYEGSVPKFKSNVTVSISDDDKENLVNDALNDLTKHDVDTSLTDIPTTSIDYIVSIDNIETAIAEIINEFKLHGFVSLESAEKIFGDLDINILQKCQTPIQKLRKLMSILDSVYSTDNAFNDEEYSEFYKELMHNLSSLGFNAITSTIKKLTDDNYTTKDAEYLTARCYFDGLFSIDDNSESEDSKFYVDTVSKSILPINDSVKRIIVCDNTYMMEDLSTWVKNITDDDETEYTTPLDFSKFKTFRENVHIEYNEIPTLLDFTDAVRVVDLTGIEELSHLKKYVLVYFEKMAESTKEFINECHDNNAYNLIPTLDEYICVEYAHQINALIFRVRRELNTRDTEPIAELIKRIDGGDDYNRYATLLDVISNTTDEVPKENHDGDPTNIVSKSTFDLFEGYHSDKFTEMIKKCSNWGVDDPEKWKVAGDYSTDDVVKALNGETTDNSNEDDETDDEEEDNGKLLNFGGAKYSLNDDEMDDDSDDDSDNEDDDDMSFNDPELNKLESIEDKLDRLLKLMSILVSNMGSKDNNTK